MSYGCVSRYVHIGLQVWGLCLAVFFIGGCGQGDDVPPGQPGFAAMTRGLAQRSSALPAGGEHQTSSSPSTATVRSIVVAPSTPKAARGLTQQFRATAVLTDGSSQDVTTLAAWSIKDTRGSDVARIDSDGLAMADSLGQARVAARYNLTTGATLLEVTPAALTKLLISPSSASIAKGTTVTFAASGEYSDGSTADVTTSVSWSVLDVMGSGVAAIDSHGTALGVATGVASVRADLAGITASAQLTVSSAVPSTLSIRPTDATVARGLRQRFTALAGFSDGTTQDVSGLVTWQALDVMGSGVASIDRTGLALGEIVGKARIVAGFRGLYAFANLEVKAAIATSLELSPPLNRVAKGRTAQYRAIVEYSDGSTLDVSSLATWRASDRMGSAVAVAGSGRRGDFLGQNVGTAEIRVDYAALTTTGELIVQPAVMDALAITPDDARLSIGGSQTFVALGTYSDGSVRDVSTLVSWTSTDLGSTLGVATVSASGVANGKLRGLAEIGAQYVSLRARAVLAVGLPAGDCAPLAFCFRSPSPHADTHTGVWAADANNVWTISEHGLVTHFDGSRFRQVAAVPGKRLSGIFGRDRSHVTVLGEDDLILRWDGSSWSRESGSGKDASGLWESSAGRLWVGAPQGRVRKFDGSTWSTTPVGTPTPSRLRAVHGSSESNIWAVGDNHAVAQWDGTSWWDRSIASATDLVGVWGLSASSLWTVSSDGFVWQWSGSSWTWPIATSRGLRAIAGADSRSILAVGPSELLWFDGSTWKSVAGTLDETLNAVHALDARSFYAAGARGSVYTWNGSSYTRKSENLVEHGSLNALWGSDSQHLWAVGGAGKIVAWDGSTLAAQSSGTSVNLFAIWGSDDRHVWASGQNGTVRFFDGTRWSPQSTGTLQYLNGLCGNSASDVWAVGSNGTILHYNGTAWSAVASPTWAELFGIWCYSATNVWAVGEDGAIVHWDGSSWQAVPSGTPERLLAVYGLNSTDIWVAGGLGLLRHYDGIKWSTIPTSGGIGDLLAVWGADASRVWIAGEGGRLLFWDGTRVIDKTLQTSSTNTLRALRGFDLRNFWAAGDDGTLLQYAP